MCESAYCILCFNSKIYAADYGKSYGLIGGRIDDGETPTQALIREIAEETKLTVDNITLIKDTGERRAFKIERCTHKDKQEIHYLYIIKVNKEPLNGEVNIVQVSKSKLIDSLPYETQKEAVIRIFRSEADILGGCP